MHVSASWASVSHKVAVNAMLSASRDVLNCDLDTFITDVDVVFMTDPWPYFIIGKKNLRDIVAQCDANSIQYKMK
jgi:hypothetical protein